MLGVVSKMSDLAEKYVIQDPLSSEVLSGIYATHSNGLWVTAFAARMLAT